MGNLYKNADKRKKIVPGGGAAETTQEQPKQEETVTVPEPPKQPVPAVAEPEIEEKAAPVVTRSLADIMDEDDEEDEGNGKSTYSLYLSDEVIAEIDRRRLKTKKKKKKSRARYVEDLLKLALWPEKAMELNNREND